MILSAIQTETGKALFRIDGEVIEVHADISSARVALILKERAVLAEHPNAPHCSKLDREDLTVVIELPKAEPAPKPSRRRSSWNRYPTRGDDPRVFRAWRLGVIRRIAESIREELMEPGEPAGLEI